MPGPDDFGLLPKLLRAASGDGRLVRPKTASPFDPANVQNILTILNDPIRLWEDLLKTGLHSFHTGMRQGGQAGLQDFMDRGGKILAQFLTYAPLGAEPKDHTSWRDVAAAAGFTENPELTGSIMSILAPGPGLPKGGKAFSTANAVIDVRPGGSFDDLRKFFARQRSWDESQIDWDKFRQDSYELTRRLQQEGRLVGYRSNASTGLGSEGLPVVFTTISPDIAKSYAKGAMEIGASNRDVVGFYIPKEASIFQPPSTSKASLEELYEQALQGGYHAFQRPDIPHELILLPRFFEDFGNKPAPVRMTGKAPVQPFDPNRLGTISSSLNRFPSFSLFNRQKAVIIGNPQEINALNNEMKMGINPLERIVGTDSQALGNRVQRFTNPLTGEPMIRTDVIEPTDPKHRRVTVFRSLSPNGLPIAGIDPAQNIPDFTDTVFSPVGYYILKSANSLPPHIKPFLGIDPDKPLQATQQLSKHGKVLAVSRNHIPESAFFRIYDSYSLEKLRNGQPLEGISYRLFEGVYKTREEAMQELLGAAQEIFRITRRHRPLYFMARTHKGTRLYQFYKDFEDGLVIHDITDVMEKTGLDKAWR